MGQTAFKKQNIPVFNSSDRPIYLLKWTNRDGQRRNVSLGTRDRTEAKAIALDLEKLANDPSVYDSKPDDPRFDGYNPKARQIFFGLKEPPKATPLVMVVTEKMLEGAREKKISGFGFIPGKAWTTVENKRANEERKKRIEAERKTTVLQRDLEISERERKELSKRLNEHCDETIGDALKPFETFYIEGRSQHTVDQVMRFNKDFAEKVGPSTRLGEIKGKNIDDYIAEYTADGEKVAQRTRQKIKAYLSVFWTWAMKRYELIGNPMDHVQTIKQDASGKIEAIREFADLKAYLDALKPWPFWRAWVAVATLAGPRWSEQAAIKVADIQEDLSYMRIYASKTRRQRTVPIEQTLLKPILKAWLQGRKRDELLFPPMFEGCWHGSTFHAHWFGKIGNPKRKTPTVIVGVSELAKKKTPDAYYWSYGPAEWRHCAGTAMGHCGQSSLRISQWLGNSEAIARQHYIADVKDHWPLDYGTVTL